VINLLRFWTEIVRFGELFMGNMKEKTQESIDDYLLRIREKGRFSFTFDELKDAINSSEQSLRKKIYRLKEKNRISIICKNFYTVLPPEYARNGGLPVYLYLDDWMKFLGRNYYLGLYSAAALDGAAHQQPMGFQVVVETPMRSMEQPNTQIDFFSRKILLADFIEKKKSASGYFNVSSPELTALDFMSFNGKIGGMTRITPVLGELIESIKPAKMYKTANAYSPISSLQRLGYLFDKVYNRQDLANSLRRALNEKSLQSVLLSVSSPRKHEIDKEWKVDVNILIEKEL
jgi:predicted transcriptional regulator of viral defense system